MLSSENTTYYDRVTRPVKVRRASWVEYNKAHYGCFGCCRLGPCMCYKVKQHNGPSNVIPRGKDEHMVDVDPLVVRAGTIAFIQYLHARHRYLPDEIPEAELKEWWGEHWNERHKVAIIQPSTAIGEIQVKRIAK